MIACPVLLLALFLPTIVLGRCCMPHVMSGSIDTRYDEVISINMHRDFDSAQFQIDFEAKRIMLSNIDKWPIIGSLIVDFGKGKMFVRSKDGSCRVAPFKHLNELQACIPEDARSMNEMLGVTDPSDAWWRFSLADAEDNVKTFISSLRLDSSACLPKGISLKFDPKDKLFYTYFFANYVTSVVDPKSNLYQNTSDCTPVVKHHIY